MIRALHRRCLGLVLAIRMWAGVAVRRLAPPSPPAACPGQVFIEYAIAGGVLAVLVLVGLTVFGNAVSDYFAALAKWLLDHQPA